jgi:hypothetical protein
MKVGLPDGIRVRALTVSEPARCLVVSATAVEGEEEQLRLFVRGFGAATYDEVPWPDGCNAFCDPIASPTAPVMYVLGMHWQDHGGNYVGVYRLRLPGLAAELARPAHEGSKSPGGSRSWFSRLLGFAADGRRILVVRASGAGSFRYSVCVLDPDDGTLEPLASLPAVFA